MPKVAVVCGVPLGPSSSCTKRTRDKTGRCHLHRHLAVPADATGNPNVAATQAAAGQVEDDGAAADGDSIVVLPYQHPNVGDPDGVVVGIADYVAVEDGMVICHHYQDLNDGGHVPVIYGKLTPEGEQRLIDSLGLSSSKTTVTVEKVPRTGRHDLDTKWQLHNYVEQVGRSINARLKNGGSLEDIRTANVGRIDTLRAILKKAEAEATDDDQGFLDHVRSQLGLLQKTVDNPKLAVDYPATKLPYLHAWSGSWSEHRKIKSHVPDHPSVADGVTVTSETGLAVRLGRHPDGRVWTHGIGTSDETHQVWNVDLGDGIRMLYTPETATEESSKSSRAPWSQRRRFAIVGPSGQAASKTLQRLGQVDINSRPADEHTAEIVFLERNFEAAELLEHPQVIQARVETAAWQHAAARVRVEEHAAETVGMSEPEVEQWVREQDAAARVEVAKYVARRLRQAYASAAGWPTARMLAESPTYQPTPAAAAGTVAYRRIGRPPGMPSKGPQRLSHNISSAGDGALTNLLKTRQVASQEKRRQMGVNTITGISESDDRETGGASGAFLHINGPAKSFSARGQLVWEGPDAEQLIESRTDVYGWPGDHFGATNPHCYQYTKHGTNGLARSTERLGKFHGGEIIVNRSIPLDLNPPTRIRCQNTKQRNRTLKELLDAGIDQIGGRPIEKLLTIG